MINKLISTLLSVLMLLLMSTNVSAEDYVIDTEGMHAFIQFKIPHLGYSILLGRFNRFEGSFSYDEKKPENTQIQVEIDTTSIDSNHAKRDKHLRGFEFLGVKEFPKAKFFSTAYKENPDGSGELTGNFSLRGITREIKIKTKKVGHGHDPWGGYRRGFEGYTKLTLTDYDIDYNLGKAATEVELFLYIEGLRKK